MPHDVAPPLPFWYLGSPYSKYEHGLDAAFTRVCEAAGLLIRAGIPVFSPIAHSHPIAGIAEIDPLDHRVWLPAMRPMMDAACGIIVLQLAGWRDSVGLRYEIDLFESAAKPVVYMTPGKAPDLPPLAQKSCATHDIHDFAKGDQGAPL